MKGQAVADFLSELTLTEEDKTPTTKETTTEGNQGWQIYVDGASSANGCGAGLLLVSPEGEEMTYALRFNFKATNNEAEYEAVITGLRLAKHLKAEQIRLHSDSQIVVSQIKGEYEVREPVLVKYHHCVTELLSQFKSVEVVHVSRTRNTRADALSKMATSFVPLPKHRVQVETLEHRSIATQETIFCVVDNGSTWMTPIVQYLSTGTVPTDKSEARRLVLRAAHYVLQDGVLYRRAYLQPLQRCVGPQEAEYLIREIHHGACSSHTGPRQITRILLRRGYYWPTMSDDTFQFIQRCEKCQRHAAITRVPQQELIPVNISWPFAQWGIDILGPFPEAPGRVKFLVVAIDYFTKWIEVEPLATITGRNMAKFVWRSIVCRFGIPHVIISDNGKQFAEDPFKTWCSELHIKQRFTSVAHPQANGQVEVTNRTILHGLKTRLDKSKGNWVEELPHVLWSYRTTPRTATDETPYSLVYGHEAVIPAEMGIPSSRVLYFAPEENEDNLRHDLDLLEEKRECALIRQAKYKAEMAKYYNKRVRVTQLKTGDLVLRRNEASHVEPFGKLAPNWEGPYMVVQTFGSGSYTLAKLDGTLLPRPWHISNLRRFYV